MSISDTSDRTHLQGLDRTSILSVTRSTINWASEGALIGAVAGLILALSDYGAIWLWLPMWNDRISLLFRILGFQLPIGAIAGFILFVILGFAQSFFGSLFHIPDPSNRVSSPRGLKLLSTTVYTLLLSPAVVWLSLMLFTGGKMSRLAHKEIWETATALFLLCGLWILIFLTHHISNKLQGSSHKTVMFFSAALLGLALLLGKIDQHFLPTQYLYLHHLLTISSFCLLAFCLHIIYDFYQPRMHKGLPLVGLGLLLILGIGFLFNLSTIDQNQNVRVALMNPRASHSRSLLLCLQPFFFTSPDREQYVSVARAAKKAREVIKPNRDTYGLPQVPDSHILLISIDALRADHLGTHGYKRPVSPNIDRLSNSSIVFENAYTQAPHSSYSLSSIMTSEYLHEVVDLGYPLPQTTIATEFNAAGFHTAAFFTLGIFHTEGKRLKVYENSAYGFSLHDHTDREAEALTDRVLEEIDRTKERGEPKSFFWVHYFDVHEPYRATTFGQSDLDRYDSEILKVDKAVERLISECRKRLQRDLVVVITADHGEEFREHGGVYHGSSLYEEQVHVPLIIHHPSLPTARIKAPVKLVDIAPTILALLDVPIPNSMRGDDLRALFSGKTSSIGPAFSAVMHKKMTVSWPYKLIADLKYKLYEIYDLEKDPQEKHNLVDRNRDLKTNMQGEIYAWLDSLSKPVESQTETLAAAINSGKLGDPRAVEPLIEIVRNRENPPDLRRDAARILGDLGNPRAISCLSAVLKSEDQLLSAEAAIALGRMYNQRGRKILQKLVLSEDPDIRTRAAVSLGRLRDKAAVPALIDALWIAPSKFERNEAVRWLGRLRDSRALEPLISILPETRTRYLVVIALGLLGDIRAYNSLSEVLNWERHSNVRDNTIRGLGLLGDPRAVDIILPIALQETELKNSSESLIRLNAIDQEVIGGADVVKGQTTLSGFRRCYVGPLLHDWNYLHRTWCETSSSKASLKLSIPESVSNSENGAVAVLSIKRVDAEQAAQINLVLGKTRLTPILVDNQWNEFRWHIDPEVLSTQIAKAQINSEDKKARFALDHLLLMPINSEARTLQGG